jgi:hypothetical protein
MVIGVAGEASRRAAPFAPASTLNIGGGTPFDDEWSRRPVSFRLNRFFVSARMRRNARRDRSKTS